jgi:cytochrome bd ubiquinol oxidase subunit II
MSWETLQTIWFVLIAVLWIGYFILEGFDFGVGILLRVVAKDEAERRTVVTTLGPVWDGNEVWLLVAGGATFAAFPEWYATLFSGFYLALLLILVALIVRGVAFEYRSKRSSIAWRNRWDWAISVASFLPALLWGVAFANIAKGTPLVLDANGNSQFDGNLFTLLNPYGLLGGLVTLALFTTHGAVFLALKTDGEIRVRANKIAGQVGLVAAVLAVVFGLWTQLSYSQNAVSWVPLLIAVGSWLGVLAANRLGREGWAFVCSSITQAGVVIFLFAALYPYVMPSSIDPAASLTIHNASSTEYTLKVMTIVAVIMTPVVLAYQAWTYWVFRKRLSPSQIPDPQHGSLDLPHEVSV